MTSRHVFVSVYFSEECCDNQYATNGSHDLLYICHLVTATSGNKYISNKLLEILC